MLSRNLLKRLHQLHGDAGINQPFALSGQLNFKFSDLPLTTYALQRKHVNYVAALRFNYKGTLTSTAGTTIPRKVLTPMLIQNVQVQGTEIGTPVSSSHVLGGYLDTDTYLRYGNRNGPSNQPGVTLAAATPQTFNHTVDVVLGNLGQAKGEQTCPLALFMQPGEVVVNNPASLAAVDASLADVTISNMTVTCHAVLLCSTEIVIANPWQLTRHKTSATSGADSIQINSFGANGTVTGVQGKCGIGALLWVGSGIVGSGAGAGAVSSLTQFAADFLGMRQNNDPRAQVQQLFEAISPGRVVNGDVNDNPLYPFFNLNGSPFDLMASAEFFPLIIEEDGFEASKLLEAVGNPSYDLTGTFTGSSHYTLMLGCYPYTGDKLADLLAIIQRSHLGLEIHKTDDLILSTKLADAQNVVQVAASEPDKLIYLPRSVIPRAASAAK